MSDATPPTDPPADAPTKDQLKGAMKAFKKRLKFTRLDQESKLTRRPVTSGQDSDVVAIVAPIDFPQAVWDELVRLGKLRRTKHGMYELAQE